MDALDLNSPVKHAGLVPVRLGKLLIKFWQRITGTGNALGAQRLSKKKELLQLVDLDLNPPNKQAGLVPVRLGKLNKTVING